MYRVVKRGFDFFSSTLLFIVISPLFAVLSILVWIKMGRPIFFRQTRTTKHQKCFEIMKFRTMTDARDEKGELLPDDERKTKLGIWLRATSLDELPELLNIINGDMSVIGPRPLQPSCNSYYTKYELNRFKVRGGLIPPETLGDNPTPTWDEQLQSEADYANNVDFVLDAKVFLKVFSLLYKRDSKDYGDYVRGDLEEERKNRT